MVSREITYIIINGRLFDVASRSEALAHLKSKGLVTVLVPGCDPEYFARMLEEECDRNRATGSNTDMTQTIGKVMPDHAPIAIVYDESLGGHHLMRAWVHVATDHDPTNTLNDAERMILHPL